MDQAEDDSEVEEVEQDFPVVDVSSFLKDTLRSCDLQSAVPELCLQEDCCMGIDEAGRGPVLGLPATKHTTQENCYPVTLSISLYMSCLGPMVYGTAFCSLSKRAEVKALGVAGQLEG